MVKLPSDELYGPTSVGTLREFIQEGLITEKTAATNINSHQSLPIGALFAALDFEKKRALRAAAGDGLKSTASLAVDNWSCRLRRGNSGRSGTVAGSRKRDS